MTRVYVELSGESLDLARAEVDAVAAVLGGVELEFVPAPVPLAIVELAREYVPTLALRLALSRRCLVETPRGAAFDPTEGGPSVPGETAAFRRLGSPSGGPDSRGIETAARAWKSAGGRIDLERPLRRFWWVVNLTGADQLLEEVATVDRHSTSARRISALPFRRPIGLAPRLARAAANLARIAPGDRVVDPFLGTGALLAEAALFGARVTGIDHEAAMVQGANRNFTHLRVTAEHLVVGDSGEVEFPGSEGPFDALLTDPPYGRASSTGGEGAGSLAARILPRWADRLRPAAFAVVVVPGGDDPLGPPWRRLLAVPVRVHRSLTREFRVYRRQP
ncbi:MAG: RsmD family RNA methyltransferase [Thermoplasmata archaeon]